MAKTKTIISSLILTGMFIAITFVLTGCDNSVPAPTCSDECSTSLCSPDREYMACLKQEDGCTHEVNKGIILEQCGVDCINNADCHYNEQCSSHKCVELKPTCFDECTRSRCHNDNYIACLIQGDGCRHEVDQGIVYGKCGVECLSDSDCNHGEVCHSNECVEKHPKPHCTDKCNTDSCDGTQYIACLKQSNGCKDNVNKGEVLHQCGVQCLTDANCLDWQVCEKYLCTIPPGVLPTNSSNGSYTVS